MKQLSLNKAKNFTRAGLFFIAILFASNIAVAVHAVEQLALFLQSAIYQLSAINAGNPGY